MWVLRRPTESLLVDGDCGRDVAGLGTNGRSGVAGDDVEDQKIKEILRCIMTQKETFLRFFL